DGHHRRQHRLVDEEMGRDRPLSGCLDFGHCSSPSSRALAFVTKVAARGHAPRSALELSSMANMTLGDLADNRYCAEVCFAESEGKPFVRFDLTDLSLFRHVIEAGSITGGAERAHLALAAASTRIRNMEEALGAALLVRGRQGVTPTQAGRTLLQHARAILRQAERLREDLGVYAGGLAGQIRVLSNTNALTEFLPEALSSFLSAHPNVSVDLEERLSDEIVGLIAEGVADLGIVAA